MNSSFSTGPDGVPESGAGQSHDLRHFLGYLKEEDQQALSVKVILHGLSPSSKTVLNSPSPVVKYCYDCKRIVWTKIKYYPTLKTRIIAIGLSPCLLCWVPFFFHWKTELDHHCSFCDGYLGTYNPFFEEKVLRAFTNVLPCSLPEEKKQPQKKYREVGRRCGEFKENEIIRVYSDIMQ